MPQLFLTKKGLTKLLCRIAQSITGLPNTAISASYQTDSQPAVATPDGQMLYVAVFPEPSAYDEQVETVYSEFDIDNAAEEKRYTRIFRALFSAYGPDSCDIADKLRFGLLSTDQRNVLREFQVSSNMPISAPTWVPYEQNGQWWDRADLTVMFNVPTVRQNTIPYIKTADIQINHETGYTDFIHIQENP